MKRAIINDGYSIVQHVVIFITAIDQRINLLDNIFQRAIKVRFLECASTTKT